MSHHVPSHDDMINIQVESFDDDIRVDVEENSLVYSPNPLDYVPHVSDDDAVWTPANSGPSSPATHAQTIPGMKESQSIANVGPGGVHVRSGSSSSLSVNLLSPGSINTEFQNYRTTVPDPIFSPADENFLGHEFPDTSTDDLDPLLFDTQGYNESQQAPSPVDSQLDFGNFDLHTAPLEGVGPNPFLQVPSRPNRPRSNTHEGTVPTVAPKDVFPSTSVSSVPTTEQLSAMQFNYEQMSNIDTDSAIADDFFPNPHSPVDSMRSTSSTLFGALGTEPYLIDPITKDPRRRKSDTGATVRPSILRLQGHQRGAYSVSSRLPQSVSVNPQFHAVRIMQQQLSPQSVQVYQSLSVPVIPDVPQRQRSGSVNSVSSASSRGRGVVRSQPGSRRHSPYIHARDVSKLPSPSSEIGPYMDNTADTNVLVGNKPEYAVKPEEPQDWTFDGSGASPGLSRNRTVPAVSPSHMPLSNNAALKRSISNPMRGKYDAPSIQQGVNSNRAVNGNDHSHPSALNADSPLVGVSVKDEAINYGVPSPSLPLSVGIQRQTVTSEATREAANKRRTKPAKFFCDHCGEGFTARHNHERHVQAHEGRRPFLCACGTAFTSKSDRKRHIDRSKKEECARPPIDLH